MDATCATCPFFAVAADGTGMCRHIKARWVEVSAYSGWCSEHPLRQRDRLAEKMLLALGAIGSAAFPRDLAKEAYELADGMIEVRRQQLEERSKGSK